MKIAVTGKGGVGKSTLSAMLAHLARKDGKTVLAVPGRSDHAQSRGANRLIRDGAKPVLEVMDVVEEVVGEHVGAVTFTQSGTLIAAAPQSGEPASSRDAANAAGLSQNF